MEREIERPKRDTVQSCGKFLKVCPAKQMIYTVSSEVICLYTYTFFSERILHTKGSYKSPYYA